MLSAYLPIRVPCADCPKTIQSYVMTIIQSPFQRVKMTGAVLVEILARQLRPHQPGSAKNVVRITQLVHTLQETLLGIAICKPERDRVGRDQVGRKGPKTVWWKHLQRVKVGPTVTCNYSSKTVP